MSTLEAKMEAGYKLFANNDLHFYVASEFDEDLLAHGLLLIDDNSKEIMFSERGNEMLSKIESYVSVEEGLDLIVRIILMVQVYCGTILDLGDDCYIRAPDGPDAPLPSPPPAESAESGVRHGEPKTWELVAPDGSKHTIHNLALWVKEHYGLFGLRADDDPARIYKRFSELARFMRKGDTRRTSCMGWKIERLPH